MSVDIEASPGRVWSAWESRRALETWLAPRAVAELRPGGPWEFFWSPQPDKDSTLGCRVLEVSPLKRARFEWQGKSDFLPLFKPPEGRRTEIVVSFEPRGANMRVVLEQSETRPGPQWAAYEEWMSSAWRGAFEALKAWCEAAPAAPRPEEPSEACRGAAPPAGSGAGVPAPQGPGTP